MPPPLREVVEGDDDRDVGTAAPAGGRRVCVVEVVAGQGDQCISAPAATGAHARRRCRAWWRRPRRPVRRGRRPDRAVRSGRPTRRARATRTASVVRGSGTGPSTSGVGVGRPAAHDPHGVADGERQPGRAPGRVSCSTNSASVRSATWVTTASIWPVDNDPVVHACMATGHPRSRVARLTTSAVSPSERRACVRSHCRSVTAPSAAGSTRSTAAARRAWRMSDAAKSAATSSFPRWRGNASMALTSRSIASIPSSYEHTFVDPTYSNQKIRPRSW